MSELARTQTRTQHTPAPWHVSEGRSIQAAWETHEIVQVCSISTSHWSTSPGHDDVPLNRSRNERMRSESEANARLIAAAPELLDALRRVIDSPFEPDKWRINVEAAIAKAQGGTRP